MVVDTAGSDAETAELINAARRLIKMFSKDNGAAIAQVKDIISAELSSPLNDDTYGSLGRRFTDYLEESTGTFLLNCLAVTDLDAAFNEVGLHQKISDIDALVRPLAYLRSLFKERLQQAQLMWRELPDDWSAVTREISFDALNNVWRYRLLIDKYGGERVVLAGPASSIVNLTTQIMKAITAFPDPEAVTPERLDELQGELAKFQTWAKKPKDVAKDSAATPAEDGVTLPAS